MPGKYSPFWTNQIVKNATWSHIPFSEKGESFCAKPQMARFLSDTPTFSALFLPVFLMKTFLQFYTAGELGLTTLFCTFKKWKSPLQSTEISSLTWGNVCLYHVIILAIMWPQRTLTQVQKMAERIKTILGHLQQPDTAPNVVSFCLLSPVFVAACSTCI